MLEFYQNNFQSDLINNNITNLFSSGAHHLKALDCNGHTEVGTIKCEKNYELCEACGLKIHDQYLMQIADSRWHESCLSCCCCNISLNTSCYVKNSKLYCKSDYERLFAIKCPGCCQKIQSNDMVIRSQSLIFHQPCFTCSICRTVLQKGEQYVLRPGGQIICLRHGHESELSQFYDEEYLLDDFITRRDGRRGPKRPRTILTSQQRKQFKAAFETSPKPCRKIREALAKDTGLSVRVVQVWFQNQRAKMKKIQRKANKNGITDDKTSEKDGHEKDIKELSENDDFSGFSSQPLNPNLPFSPEDFPANSNDSYCSSDESIDDFDDDIDGDLDGSFENVLQQVPNQITTSSSNNVLINPIEKLYLMESSYFSEV